MTGGNESWPDLGSQNERLVVPLADQDERLLDPQIAQEAGLPVEPRPLVPRSRPAADDEPDGQAAGSGQRGWSGLRRLRRGRPVAAAAAVVSLAAAALAAGGLTAPHQASAATAARPDAGGWRITLNLTAKHNPQFTAITATGPAAAWAFEAFDPGTAAPAAWQLTGSGWHHAAFPGKSSEQVVAAGSTSASNVWAFTQKNFTNGPSRALRWNGSGWQVLGTFSRAIGGAAVLGPRDVWVFGVDVFGQKELGARHWNGHRWTTPSSGHGLTAGSGLAANDVWAVGGKQVAHWNGHTWQRTSLAGVLPPNTLLAHPFMEGIYEQSPSSVWAIASGGRQDEGGPVILLHFNGHSWSKVAQRGFGDPVQIVPDGSGGLWIPVPGLSGAPSQILHFTGGKLHQVALPITSRRLIVQAIAHAPGTTRSFGAGQIHKLNSLGLGLHAVLLQVN